jgi:hypothetical protein
VADEVEPGPAERVGDPQHVEDQFVQAVPGDVARPDVRGVAALVGRDRPEPGVGERAELALPLRGELREAVQQEHAPAVLRARGQRVEGARRCGYAEDGTGRRRPRACGGTAGGWLVGHGHHVLRHGMGSRLNRL